MKPASFRILAAATFSTVLCFKSSTRAGDPATAHMPSPDHFDLHGDGGWDYLTITTDGKLLYVPRTTHTLIVDTATGKVIADVPGTEHSHGTAIAPAVARAFVTDSGDGSVEIVDTKTNVVLGKVKAADDADGVIFDPASNKVFVGCGDAARAVIPISPDVDPAKGSADPAIDLGGKPEFLAADGTGHVYVNVQSKDEVAVIDSKTMKVTAHWTTGARLQADRLGSRPRQRPALRRLPRQEAPRLSTTDGASSPSYPSAVGMMHVHSPKASDLPVAVMAR